MANLSEKSDGSQDGLDLWAVSVLRNLVVIRCRLSSRHAHPDLRATLDAALQGIEKDVRAGWSDGDGGALASAETNLTLLAEVVDG